MTRDLIISLIHEQLQIPDDMVSFIADVVGVLLGAFLGYLLGLRQQRKIDSERDIKRKQELKEALKDELDYLQKEVSKQPEPSSELFEPLGFDVVILDLPTFASIVNSGQLLLLDSEVVRSLRELNTRIHEHNTAQAVLVGVVGFSDSAGLTSQLEESRKIALEKGEQPNSRFVGLLKVVMTKRKSIAQMCQDLSPKLS